MKTIDESLAALERHRTTDLGRIISGYSLRSPDADREEYLLAVAGVSGDAIWFVAEAWGEFEPVAVYGKTLQEALHNLCEKLGITSEVQDER